MAATITYVIVGIGVVTAASIYFFFMPKPSAQPAAGEKVSAPVPKKPNQNVLLDGSEEMGDADVLANKAFRYMEKGSYTDAAKLLEFSLNIYKEKGQQDFMVADKYLSLGKCYGNLKEYGKAIGSYKAAMDIYKKHPADIGIPPRRDCLLSLAKVLRDLGQEKEAREREEEAKNLESAANM
jgi:tetratricopeptide (TPR) repeat protein